MTNILLPGLAVVALVVVKLCFSNIRYYLFPNASDKRYLKRSKKYLWSELSPLDKWAIRRMEARDFKATPPTVFCPK